VEEEENIFVGGGGREGRRMWSVGKVFLLMLGEEGKEERKRKRGMREAAFIFTGVIFLL